MELKTTLLTAVLGLALGSQLFAAEVVRYEGQSTGSKVRMDGDSTIHRWSAESTLVSGFMEFEQGFALDAVKLGPVNAKVEVFIPVRTLKSSSGRAMDNVMYSAMAATNFPKIDFRLTSLDCTQPGREKVPPSFAAKGNLVVMGHTNPVTLAVTIESPAKDQLLVKTAAKVKMKMTDYKIVPPKIDLVVAKIVTDDNIEIGLEWRTALAAPDKK